MFLARTLVVCSLAVAFFLTASVADAAKPKVKKKKQHHVAGVVVAKEDGTFSVKVHVGKKKKAAGTEEKDEKFKVGEGTKFVKVTGKKKDRSESEARKHSVARMATCPEA